LRLRISEEGLYRVEEDFPRLTPVVFREAVPAGIERVEYEVNLSGYAHLRIASEPSAKAVGEHLR
jgi:hypothetical protein